MIIRKYWALRLSQIILVLSSLQVIVMVPIAILETKIFNLFPFLTVLLIFVIFFGIPLWFLFKKSTVAQFKNINSS